MRLRWWDTELWPALPLLQIWHRGFTQVAIVPCHPLMPHFNSIMTTAWIVYLPKSMSTIEGSHVTSYQANFARRHTCHCHADFLSTWHGIGKKQTKCFVTFYLVHITLLNYNGVTGISAHTLCWNFKSLHEGNPKFKHFYCFSPHTAVQKETKRCYKIVCV